MKTTTIQIKPHVQQQLKQLKKQYAARSLNDVVQALIDTHRLAQYQQTPISMRSTK